MEREDGEIEAGLSWYTPHIPLSPGQPGHPF